MENKYHYNHREIPQSLSKSTKHPSTQLIEDNRASHKQTSELIRSICKNSTITAVRQMKWDYENDQLIKNGDYKITAGKNNYSITKLMSSQALTEDENKNVINDLRNNFPKDYIRFLDPILQHLIMYDAGKLKATSENAFGYGSIYFESKRGKESDMQRIRLLHSGPDMQGPSFGSFNTDVKWYSTTGGGIGNSTEEPFGLDEPPGITEEPPSIEQQDEVSLKEFFYNRHDERKDHLSRGHTHDLSMPEHEGLNQDGIDEIVKLISKVENIVFEGDTEEKKLEAKNRYTMIEIRRLIDTGKLPKAFGQELAFAAISEKSDENYESVSLGPLEQEYNSLIEVFEKQKKYCEDREDAQSKSSALSDTVSDLDKEIRNEMQNYKNSIDWKDKLKIAFCCQPEIEDRIINNNSKIAAKYDIVVTSISPLKDKISSHFWPFINRNIEKIEMKIEGQKDHKLTNKTWNEALQETNSIKRLTKSIDDALKNSIPTEMLKKKDEVDAKISAYDKNKEEKYKKEAIWDIAQAYKEFSKYL